MTLTCFTGIGTVFNDIERRGGTVYTVCGDIERGREQYIQCAVT